MRLLQTKDICLEEFYTDVPEYAILSHTWGAEEVLFDDLALPASSRTKAGWSKILSCCALAAGEGWNYIWIDTCCIDKKSSAELSEAINSMFAWYENASICYAYLADVDLTLSEDGHRSTDLQLQKSRWFTRGWTLQELLAPPYIAFMDCHWSFIGSRASLAQDIENVTRISPMDMIGFRSCCVAQKMSWAARRRTTRVEDQAYCLMGLFRINMPLLYGEGERAFIRLQEEILKTSDDVTIFAWRMRSDGGDPYRYKGNHGLLARDPVLFYDSHNVRPFRDSCSEILVNKQGIALTMSTAVINLSPTEYTLALLDCSHGMQSAKISDKPIPEDMFPILIHRLPESKAFSRVNMPTEEAKVLGHWFKKGLQGVSTLVQKSLLFTTFVDHQNSHDPPNIESRIVFKPADNVVLMSVEEHPTIRIELTMNSYGNLPRYVIPDYSVMNNTRSIVISGRTYLIIQFTFRNMLHLRFCLAVAFRDTHACGVICEWQGYKHLYAKILELQPNYWIAKTEALEYSFEAALKWGTVRVSMIPRPSLREALELKREVLGYRAERSYDMRITFQERNQKSREETAESAFLLFV